ncbi:MAG: hypothetical protein AUH78_14140 [Gemmatimonadetes bacterium 13_1_40CM_4_69_8]|nr:MAG: hypothetical protein AUH78_14140 [Gemmatimonadetes bacterium 13_1_40CM_4_69_8]
MLRTVRSRYLLLSDVILIGAAPFLAYALRFEGFTWRPDDARTAFWYGAASLPLKIGIFVAFGLYRRLWRHASIPDLGKIVEAAAASAALCAVLGAVVLPGSGWTAVRTPLSTLFLDSFFTTTALACPRLLIRVLAGWQQPGHASNGKRALIVGAGAAGEMILRELRRNPQLGLTPVGFVDDDAAKRHQRLNDLPVLGSLSEIRPIVARHGIAEIVIAMPTAPGTVVRSVVRAAMDAQVPARTVPGLFEILSGKVGISNLRNVEIEDLLRREPVNTDLHAVRAIVTGHSVLVTGAGGSIGSELARQLARLEPAQLGLLGNSENEIFDILNELAEAHPTLRLVPVIADVRDGPRLHSVFVHVQPHVVFHAAAHKHVPLMEANVADAITNNVLGTRNVVDCALACHSARLVLISTDKAVRPVSVMGATKRAAEMLVQCAATMHRRPFVSVRFGNVLGSRGSVVPIFLRQIRAGGPVTLTHPEMRRFFMTIPEATQLVLQAGALGRGGEVFVLDMGKPIRIVDLAADLVRLSGLEVGKDIQLRFTGIRPGERLNEEMFLQGEDVIPTEHPKILRATNHQPAETVLAELETVIAAAQGSRPDAELRALLRAAVPEFCGSETPRAEEHATAEQQRGRDRRAERPQFPTYRVPLTVDAPGRASP